MRIVSGSLKGRKIIAPKNLPVRPTTDMAKEALFNILNNSYYLDDISVLDLFAGTGNISYEFASRGCSDIIAVDQFHGCVKFIETVSKQFDLPISALKKDVFKYLSSETDKYDIVFADPPYDLKTIIDLPNLIIGSKLLKNNGLLILEHGFENDLSTVQNFIEKRTYSRVNFSFFKSNQ